MTLQGKGPASTALTVTWKAGCGAEPGGWAWPGFLHPLLTLHTQTWLAGTISLVKSGSEAKRFNYPPRGNWCAPPHLNPCGGQAKNKVE